MKRVFALLMVLCLAAALPLTAMAAQETEMIRWAQEEPGRLTMLLSAQPEPGAYSAVLDGQELSLSGGTAAEQKLAVSIYCLVDTSGSISDFKMRLIKETLTTLSESMSAQDNMILATVDNAVQESAVLTTQAARTEAINAIASSYKDTNLYTGIVTGLNRLASATDLNPVRALVVLSDGYDAQSNGVTEQETRDAIAKTRLPIYTVAVAENYNERDGAKVLSSFARSSCGGLYQTTIGEGAHGAIQMDSSGAVFGSAIWENLLGSQYLTADLTDFPFDGSRAELRLSVSYTTSNSAYTDSVLLSAAALTPVPEETGPAETDAEPAPEPEASSASPYVWIAVAVGAAVILAVVLVVIKKKKKPIESTVTTDAGQETGPISQEPPAFECSATEPVSESASPAPEPEGSQKTCEVELVDIPHGDNRCKFTIPMDTPVIFGRNNKARCVIDAQDSRLSGAHFAILVNQGLVCIQDQHSTNGTFANGVAVSPTAWTKIESGDKIRAGSREYRITIHTEEA